MAVTVNGVELHDRWSGYRKGRDQKGGETVVKEYFFRSYADSDAVLEGLLGTVTVTGPTDGTGTVIRVIPHRCPEKPSLYATSAYCEEGVAEQIPDDNGAPTWGGGIVSVTYGTPEFSWDAADDPTGRFSFPNSDNPNEPYLFAIQNLAIATEEVRIPDGGFVFETVPKIPLENATRTVGVVRFRYTKKFVPYLPTTEMQTYAGKLNDRVMFNAPIGHLKFEGGSTVKEFTSDGVQAREMELEWIYRTVDWRKEVRPDTGAWDLVHEKDNSAAYKYELADFRSLLP